MSDSRFSQIFVKHAREEAVIDLCETKVSSGNQATRLKNRFSSKVWIMGGHIFFALPVHG